MHALHSYMALQCSLDLVTYHRFQMLFCQFEHSHYNLCVLPLHSGRVTVGIPLLISLLSLHLLLYFYQVTVWILPLSLQVLGLCSEDGCYYQAVSLVISIDKMLTLPGLVLRADNNLLKPPCWHQRSLCLLPKQPCCFALSDICPSIRESPMSF